MAFRDSLIDEFIKAAKVEATKAPQFSATSTAKYQELRGRRGKELELWQTWKETKKEEDLHPLISSLNPLIKREAAKRMKGLGGSIPRAALENELRISAVKSLKTYDPEKAALPTHVTRGFQRVSDFVNANRNAKYSPSDDMKKYDRFQNATAELRGELGRDPTADELANRLPWSAKTVKKLQKSFGTEVHTDMGDGITSGEDYALLHPRDAFQMVRSGLTQEEQQFGNMYFPPEGEKRPAIKNIAKTLDIPPHRAYRLKANVETRVGKVLRRQ